MDLTGQAGFYITSTKRPEKYFERRVPKKNGKKGQYCSMHFLKSNAKKVKVLVLWLRKWCFATLSSHFSHQTTMSLLYGVKRFQRHTKKNATIEHHSHCQGLKFSKKVFLAHDQSWYINQTWVWVSLTKWT